MNMLSKILKNLNANSSQKIEDKKQGNVEEKIYRVEFGGKKYKVHAEDETTAIQKVKEYNCLKDTDFNISIEDIFNAISHEIERIVKVAHPETVTNSYDRWVAVLTEELGEIVHEINDAYEGKPANKNTFVECVQLASATILLAKKFANEHKEMFVEEKIDEKL